MEAVVSVLALVGAVVVGSWLVRTLTGSARLLRVTNYFQTASVEAVSAIREGEPHDIRVVRALAAWERSRAMLRALSAGEQMIVAETLRDRGFPTSEVCQGITAYINEVERESAGLDEQLEELLKAGAEAL